MTTVKPEHFVKPRSSKLEAAAIGLWMRFRSAYQPSQSSDWLTIDNAERNCWRVLAALPVTR